MTEEKTTPIDNTTDLIEKAKEAAYLLKAQNDRKEELLKREESLEARRTLGGKSEHQEQPIIEETPQAYAKRVMSGKL